MQIFNSFDRFQIGIQLTRAIISNFKMLDTRTCPSKPSISSYRTGIILSI
ncbi:uncharacterized protein DS421_16g541850 [Arachis hypogaea]|nr:uncharacterized protein DS421_16g541850 [Arachis hypogaea]